MALQMSCSNRQNQQAASGLLIGLLLLLLQAAPCNAQESELGVKEAFQSFAMVWVDQLQNAYLYTSQSPKLEKKSGGVLASYHYLDRNSIKWDVKPAKNLPGVYTGVLYYNEHLVQSRGHSKPQALSGQFSTVSIKQMMEIFLYENGAWVK